MKDDAKLVWVFHSRPPNYSVFDCVAKAWASFACYHYPIRQRLIRSLGVLPVFVTQAGPAVQLTGGAWLTGSTIKKTWTSYCLTWQYAPVRWIRRRGNPRTGQLGWAPLNPCLCTRLSRDGASNSPLKPIRWAWRPREPRGACSLRSSKPNNCCSLP